MKIISIAFYPLVFLLYCFLLPRELFFEISEIKSVLVFFEEFIPSFTKLRKNSNYPDLYSFALLIGYLFIPIQIYLVNKSGDLDEARKISKSHKKQKDVFGGIIIALVVIFYLTYAFGGYVEGTSKSAKFMNSVISNRFYFSIYIGLFYLMLAVGLSGAYIHLTKFITMKGN